MKQNQETIFEAAQRWARINAPEAVSICVEHPEYGVIRSTGSSSDPFRSQLNLLAFVHRFRAIPCDRFKLGTLANRKHRCSGEPLCGLCSEIRALGFPSLDHLEYFKSESGSPLLASHPYEIDFDKLAAVCGRHKIGYRVFDREASWYFPYRTHLVILGEERYLRFRALAEQEPRLRILESEILALRRHCPSGFCANAAWYGGLREKMSQLVGWDVKKTRPEIGTAEAYEIAYDYLYDLLPNCRHRGCCW